jgi:hypothetical protein
MKKIVAFLVLILSLVTMTACTSAFSNTRVRVVALSYSTSNTELAMKPEKNQIKLLSNKLLADEVEEYIFPGDILTFTIELEDPNFEFISLLSIKFNDQVIRANVDDSIVTTRDCGANICVDFPFEISADKSEYTVQEVKFAKLNSDAGVNAIIDNQSDRTVTLDVYNMELAPFVLESVQTLNYAIQEMEYFEDGAYIDTHIWNRITVPEYSGRTFFISGYQGLYDLPDLHIDANETWSYIMKNAGNDYTVNWPQYIVLSYISYAYGHSYINGPRLHFNCYESKFKDAYFFNVGNAIYVNIFGSDHFVIELRNSMKVEYFEPLTYVS